jgi:hypothetical protein
MEKTMSTSTNDPYKGLKENEYDDLEYWIFDHLNKTGQKVKRIEIATLLYEFGSKFNLPAMYRFFKYAQSVLIPAEEILATIVHDLNGKNENPAIFEPRTATY